MAEYAGTPNTVLVIACVVLAVAVLGVTAWIVLGGRRG